jgi:hypothetical protein
MCAMHLMQGLCQLDVLLAKAMCGGVEAVLMFSEQRYEWKGVETAGSDYYVIGCSYAWTKVPGRYYSACT